MQMICYRVVYLKSGFINVIPINSTLKSKHKVMKNEMWATTAKMKRDKCVQTNQRQREIT